MKLKNILANYWGDILFLLTYPLLYDMNSHHLGWWYVDETSFLYLFIAFAVFAVFSFVWVAAFWKKRRRALRDLQYPLYCLTSALYVMVYYVASSSFSLFRWIDRLFIPLALARFGLWLNERRNAKP